MPLPRQPEPFRCRSCGRQLALRAGDALELGGVRVLGRPVLVCPARGCGSVRTFRAYREARGNSLDTAGPPGTE